VNPKDLRATYKMIFESDDGQIILDDLSRRFGLYRTSFVPDSNETAFREGQRDVLLFLHSILRDEPKEQ
tara:strand:+ start:183 stop:389 length:207 start_codon:yes stop_codon:yes gene_type:complete